MANVIEVRAWLDEDTSKSVEALARFGRDALLRSYAPVPMTEGPSTNYSWHKALALFVTTADASAVSNRQIRWAAAPPIGVTASFKVSSTFSFPSHTNTPPRGGSNNETPVGYTALTTTFQTYDAVSAVGATNTRNGVWIDVLVGLSDYYGGSFDSSLTLPNLEFRYTEGTQKTRTVVTELTISDLTFTTSPVILEPKKVEYELRDSFSVQ